MRHHVNFSDEFFVQMVWFLLAILIYGGCILPFVPVHSYIRSPVMNLLTCSACYSACFTSTYWVIQRYHRQIDRIERVDGASPRCHRHDIKNILANEDGFDLFALHLVHEFATENLLFLFEIMQIKQQCIKQKLISMDAIGYTIEMPKVRLDVIKRDNLVDIDNIFELKNAIKYIIKQYIRLGAEYCVNIASFTRFRLLTDFDELEAMTPRENTSDAVTRNMYILTGGEPEIEDEKQSAETLEECNIRYLTHKYLTICDEAMNEIMDLIKSDPLTRFYHSESYKMLLKDKII